MDNSSASWFVSTLASPRLTAALILWCFPEWRADTPRAARFRFSAGLLASRLPWLVAGGEPDEVANELARLARSMPTSISIDALLEGWRNWLRAGVAFAEFDRLVATIEPLQLAGMLKAETVEAGDLLWQGQFCISEARYRRDKQTKAAVCLLGGSESKKIVGAWLAPVSELLKDPKVLGLHEGSRKALLEIISHLSRQLSS